MLLKQLLFFLILISSTSVILAQRIITGRILDVNTKEAIENVDVAIYKGTTTTSTNSRGYFQLTAQNEDSLLFTHKQYKTGLIAVPEKDVFKIYLELFTMYPTYLEGTASLYQSLNRTLKYPSNARMKRIEGVLLVLLTIDANGQIADCICINDIGGNCGKSAIKVFKEIPGNWSPSQAENSFIFPLVYLHGDKTKIFNLPKVDMPTGKMMDKIMIEAFNN